MSLHCKFHVHAELTYTPVEIPKFAQTEYSTSRYEVRCTKQPCPFITSVGINEVRLCRACGKHMTEDNIKQGFCWSCLHKRRKRLDSL